MTDDKKVESQKKVTDPPAKITRPESLTDTEFKSALAEAESFDITTDAGKQRYVERFAANKASMGWRSAPSHADRPEPIPVRCTVHDSHPGLWTITALNADGSPERSLVQRGDVFNWLKGTDALAEAVADGKVEALNPDDARRVMRMRDATDKEIEMVLGPLPDEGESNPDDLPYPKPRAAARLS